MSADTLPEITLAGRRIHAITEEGSIDAILSALDHERGGWVVTHNLDHMRRLQRDERFATLCAKAPLVVADGMPLIWASRVQGTPLPERVAGSSLISTLSARAADAGRSVYLLGGDEGTAEEAARVLRERHPELKIAGTDCPPFGFENDEGIWAAMAERLEAARPDIVFVALGSPKQEYVIERLLPVLPRAWWLGVGISFSFLSGDVQRAPRWIQKLGLEWAHRLFQEPRRLARRYLVEGIPFGVSLLLGAWRARGRTSAP